MAENYHHLVQIDSIKRKLEIFRLSPNGEVEDKILYTVIDIPPAGSIDRNVFKEVAARLGEDILIDSPVARRIFNL